MTTNNPHAWLLSDLDNVPKNGIKVMSTFSCGGGSSMGYKRAGCEVIAANDIDKEMAWHYQHNLKPLHYYLCPIRDLLNADLPAELFNLDILDGSPPCSTFSMAGNREKDWGKDKHFREGQTKQVLSDLFFDYLDLVEKLKPKVGIAENVKGLIIGNAKGYAKLIMARFKEIGYRPQLFLVNAADCGVPQRRERVFFIALRNDIQAPPLVLAPQHRWIGVGDAINDLQILTDEEKTDTQMTFLQTKYWNITKPGTNFADAVEKSTGKSSWFNNVRMHKDFPSFTLSSQPHKYHHFGECRFFSYREWKRLGSFPDDYHAKTDKIGKYMVGMSVPPKMTEAVARAVCEQWLPNRGRDIPAAIQSNF
jgi:DNA (cytosine-5)-methyltransferase 1